MLMRFYTEWRLFKRALAKESKALVEKIAKKLKMKRGFQTFEYSTALPLGTATVERAIQPNETC